MTTPTTARKSRAESIEKMMDRINEALDDMSRLCPSSERHPHLARSTKGRDKQKVLASPSLVSQHSSSPTSTENLEKQALLRELLATQKGTIAAQEAHLDTMRKAMATLESQPLRSRRRHAHTITPSTSSKQSSSVESALPTTPRNDYGGQEGLFASHIETEFDVDDDERTWSHGFHENSIVEESVHETRGAQNIDRLRDRLQDMRMLLLKADEAVHNAEAAIDSALRMVHSVSDEILAAAAKDQNLSISHNVRAAGSDLESLWDGTVWHSSPKHTSSRSLKKSRVTSTKSDVSADGEEIYDYPQEKLGW